MKYKKEENDSGELCERCECEVSDFDIVLDHISFTVCFDCADEMEMILEFKS